MKRLFLVAAFRKSAGLATLEPFKIFVGSFRKLWGGKDY
jgi:hypothetical protein